MRNMMTLVMLITLFSVLVEAKGVSKSTETAKTEVFKPSSPSPICFVSPDGYYRSENFTSLSCQDFWNAIFQGGQMESGLFCWLFDPCSKAEKIGVEELRYGYFSERKFCSVCQKEKKKSKVFRGISSCTLLACPAYYDEDGKFVLRNCNTCTVHFSCSNGHSWDEKE